MNSIRRESVFWASRAKEAARGGAMGMLMFLWVVGSPAPVSGQERPSGGGGTPELPKINPDGLTSASICGQCHQAIHAVWQRSLHARAWSNAVFQAAYRRTVDEYGPKDARICLQCHAPTVRHTGDFDVDQPITKEGITCDFCHSIKDVHLENEADPIELTVGATKYGPLRHVQSPAHEIVDTQLHTRSEFCAACHQYKNAKGLQILNTYEEWKKSSYARKQEHCQDCHMPLVPGRVVALHVKDSAESVNLHDISGSHDLERVREAVAMKVGPYDWIEDRLFVFVQVANEGSGHCFPTGLPLHRAALEVTLHDGTEQVARQEIPFGVVILDEEGRPLTRECDIFLRGARIRSDTRIRPNESRTIDVVFSDLMRKRLSLTATLYYEYVTETLVDEEGGQRIEPVEMRFLIASDQKTIRAVGR